MLEKSHDYVLRMRVQKLRALCCAAMKKPNCLRKDETLFAMKAFSKSSPQVLVAR